MPAKTSCCPDSRPTCGTACVLEEGDGCGSYAGTRYPNGCCDWGDICVSDHCCPSGNTWNFTTQRCQAPPPTATCFELGGDGYCQGLPGTKDYCCATTAYSGHCEECCAPENIYENCGECEYCNTTAGLTKWKCSNQLSGSDFKNDCPINKACNGYGGCSCVDYGALHSPPCSWPAAPIVEDCVKYELIMCVDDCNDCPGGCEIGPNPFFRPIYQTCCLADNTPECVDRCVLEEGDGCNGYASTAYPNGCCDPFDECVNDHCCPEGATWNFTTHRCDTPGTCTVSPPTCDVTWGCTGPTGCYKETINQNCPTGYNLVKELGASMVPCAKAPPCAAVNPVQGCKCCAEGMPATSDAKCTDCNSNWRLSNCHCCPTGENWNSATARCEEECPLEDVLDPSLTYSACANEHTGGSVRYSGECGRACYNFWWNKVKYSKACSPTEQCVRYAAGIDFPNDPTNQEGVKFCNNCVENLAECCYPGMVVGEGDEQACNDCGMYLEEGGCNCCPKDYEWDSVDSTCKLHTPCFRATSDPSYCGYQSTQSPLYNSLWWTAGPLCIDPTRILAPQQTACCYIGQGLFGWIAGDDYYYWHETKSITIY